MGWRGETYLFFVSHLEDAVSTLGVVDRGPYQVSRSIMVDAPASSLFEILVHPGRHHEIDGSGTAGHVESEEAPMVQGGTFTVRMKAAGVPYSITSTATEIVPGRVVEWRHPAGHRWRYDLELVGSGKTRVTETWDYREARGRWAHELFGFPKRNARGIEQTLVRMAQRFCS